MLFRSTSSNESIGTGLCYNATDWEIHVNLPVTMRGAPSFTSAGGFTGNDGTGTNAASTIALVGSNFAGKDTALLLLTGSSGSWSATYRPMLTYSSSSSGKLFFSSEL